MYRSRAVVIVAILFGLAAWLQVSPAPGGVERQSGVQVTPDCKRTLISKDVNGQRWAITRNSDDNTVTGNVYTEGSDPLFLYCTQVSATADELTLSCYGADKCDASPCGGDDQFQFIAEVPLALSFFQPPGVSEQTPACVLPGSEVASAAQTAASGSGTNGAAGVRQSGLQVSPDGKRTLINKDVNGQRWTITRNDDGSVTGNVYQPGGGDPLFLFCTQVAATADTVTVSCSGADKCTAAPCGGDQFNFIAQVELPQSFFAPPGGGGGTCGNNVIEGDEECDGSDFGGASCDSQVGGFDACTGSIACGANCRFNLTGCNCPCEGDADCDAVIDCSAIVAECEVLGACEGGRCYTSPTGTAQLCNGSDPDDPEFKRCEE